MNCSKCSHEGIDVLDYSAGKITTQLCSICRLHAPTDERVLKIYINEKIDGKILDIFRMAKISISDRTKKGMVDKAASGDIIGKPPKGYKIMNKKMVVDENAAQIVRNMFEEYLNTQNSLSWMAKKYNLTTSGIIKILKNPAYIGMIKVKDVLMQGNHQALISKELFDKVQEKFK